MGGLVVGDFDALHEGGVAKMAAELADEAAEGAFGEFGKFVGVEPRVFQPQFMPLGHKGKAFARDADIHFGHQLAIAVELRQGFAHIGGGFSDQPTIDVRTNGMSQQ